MVRHARGPDTRPEQLRCGTGVLSCMAAPGAGPGRVEICYSQILQVSPALAFLVCWNNQAQPGSKKSAVGGTQSARCSSEAEMYRRCGVWLLLLSAIGWCQQNSSAPSLTIYNQDFAVVRQTVPLQLKAGVNNVSFDNVTSHLEPSSVMLRDQSGKVHFSILEQNYRTD